MPRPTSAAIWLTVSPSPVKRIEGGEHGNAGAGGIPRLPLGVTREEPRQRSGATVSCTRVPSCGEVEQAQRAGVILAQDQQHAASLLGLGRTPVAARQAVEPLGPMILGLRFRQPAELEIEIAARERQARLNAPRASDCEASASARRSVASAASRSPAAASQRREITPHRARVQDRPRALVYDYRLGEGGDACGIIAAARGQPAEAVKYEGGFRLVTRGAVKRQRGLVRGLRERRSHPRRLRGRPDWCD